ALLRPGGFHRRYHVARTRPGRRPHRRGPALPGPSGVRGGRPGPFGVRHMPAPFAAALLERPLLGDGAMGTMLYARGVPLDTCFDVLNESDPKIVQSIHTEYIQ